ncbi:hypothetical protein BJY04DRAFT_134738 [Aspergillus karnatakaensis]|uniref:uncharacterized protein n=1 Tax=Aspergillus karnatakaensis TaxID=1810916 RepID=UPI003CCE3E74
MAREPLCAPNEIPFLKTKKGKRLTNTRLKQILRAASRDFDDPPPKPGLGECCGSSCDPCVNDLWREEVACWRERWGDDGIQEGGEEGKKIEITGGNDEGKGGGKGEGNGVKAMQRKMPGAFEW